MPDSSEHERYLAQRDFKPKCSTKIFDERGVRDLKRYGHWMQALADGTIEPETDEQERFLTLVHDDERPDSDESRGAYFADLWWRYQRRMEWERR